MRKALFIIATTCVVLAVELFFLGIYFTYCFAFADCGRNGIPTHKVSDADFMVNGVSPVLAAIMLQSKAFLEQSTRLVDKSGGFLYARVNCSKVIPVIGSETRHSLCAPWHYPLEINPKFPTKARERLVYVIGKRRFDLGFMEKFRIVTNQQLGERFVEENARLYQTGGSLKEIIDQHDDNKNVEIFIYNLEENPTRLVLSLTTPIYACQLLITIRQKHLPVLESLIKQLTKSLYFLFAETRTENGDLYSVSFIRHSCRLKYEFSDPYFVRWKSEVLRRNKMSPPNSPAAAETSTSTTDTGVTAPVEVGGADRMKLEGDQHFEVKSYEKAAQCYSSAIGIEQSAVIFLSRAEAYLYLKKFTHARKDALTVLDMEQSNEKAQRIYIMSLIGLGRKAEALLELKNLFLMQKGTHNYTLYELIDIHSLKQPLRPSTAEKEENGNIKVWQLGIFEDDDDCVISANAFTSEKQNLQYASLAGIQQKLSPKVHKRIEHFWLNNIEIDEKLMETLRSFDPVCWSGRIDLKYVHFSEPDMLQHFEEMFDKILQPYELYLGHIAGFDNDYFFKAINRLQGLKYCDSVNLNSEYVEGQMDLNDLVQFLHSQTNENEVRQRMLIIGVKQIGEHSITDVFNALQEKFKEDSGKQPFRLRIYGGPRVTKQVIPNEQTSELLYMYPSKFGTDIVRAAIDDFKL
ncbi:small glutamine-rich tetratricopeptide repeat-containing protein beta [Ditylenchus destructor]|nr:small glutamine-rich tetratricopeptide repeat-containing protein beta [Ditylenchus destructor]